MSEYLWRVPSFIPVLGAGAAFLAGYLAAPDDAWYRGPVGLLAALLTFGGLLLAAAWLWPPLRAVLSASSGDSRALWLGAVLIAAGVTLVAGYFSYFQAPRSAPAQAAQDAPPNGGGNGNTTAAADDGVEPEEPVADGPQDDVGGAPDPTVFAGSDRNGYTGDGGPAIEAQLWGPHGIDVGADGNVYFAAEGNNAIRTVDPSSGLIETFAGSGEQRCGEVVATARETAILAPKDVAVGPSGFLFIADENCHRILRVAPDGRVAVVAGNGEDGYSGDGGPAQEASLNMPYGVAVDRAGALYIADFRNSRIRKVDPSGIITTIAGTGTEGFSGDGGPATMAELNEPLRVAVDGQNRVYIVDRGNQRVRRIDADGTIRTVAGTGSRGLSGDGGSAVLADLNNPLYVEPLSDGAFLIADHLNNRVRLVDSSGIIRTILGEGDDPQTEEPFIDGVAGLAVAPDGTLYLSELNRHRVRSFALDEIRG